ncbi:MAG TPA: hypothetical protein VFK70_02580, partial [Vicinamibacteria bacterium]|nr:hypothetical protein [Vicinamibacteria bacterium]
MPSCPRSPFTVARAAWVAAALFAACRPGPPPEPVIEFTSIPPANVGGPEKLGDVAGRVTAARPDQRIVLFALSGGVWYVQPFRSWPFTTIEKDSTWKNHIHLGTEYTALLVGPDYRPSATMESLPQRGGSIAAVATVKGSGPFAMPSSRTITFSGYDWEVRQLPTDRHALAADYDARNVTVDAEGRLHLSLTRREGHWSMGEAWLTRPLGYGTYQFEVRAMSDLDPEAAFEVWTWDGRRPDQNWAELGFDVRASKDPGQKNAQYVVQPGYVAANVFRFPAPPGRLTHSFRWQPGTVAFETVRGTAVADGGAIVAQRQFTSGVPVAGAAGIHIGIFHPRNTSTPPARDGEVVVEK